MPIVRNVVHRSRRLSNQSPIAVEDYAYEDSFIGTIDFPSRLASLSSPHETKITVPDISKSLSPVLSHLLSFHKRSSHSRKKEEGHIPRPPNAFIVFRSCLWSNEDFRNLESDHRNVSRIAGERWRNLSDEEKEPFVRMAKEAKALHVKMYPNYKYSPSHRSVAGSKHKPRRISEEKTKCDMIVSFLQKGVGGSALAQAMSNLKSGNENEVTPTPILLPSAPMLIPSALPHFQSPERRCRKKTVVRPRVIHPTSAQHHIAGPNLATMMGDCSLPATSTSWCPEEDAAPTLEQSNGTPELLYPSDITDEFVPIDDIPPLNLDVVCNMNMKVAELDPLSVFPPGVKPAGGLAYFGSGLDVMPFDDCCFLGANANIQLPPMPPPVVFTNPWSTLASRSPDNELDPFFVQPISAVPVQSLYNPVKDHTIAKYTPSEIDPIAKDGQHFEVNLDDWIQFNW